LYIKSPAAAASPPPPPLLPYLHRSRHSKRRKSVRPLTAKPARKAQAVAPLLCRDDRSAIKFPPRTARKDKMFDFEKGFKSLYTPKQIS